MIQHPIPRQITTFEFKLIGFMTLKQFLYLVVFVPMAFIFYKIIPLPLINILLGILTLLLGLVLAFVPINDRPSDVWIKNLIKRLTSPTQFIYKKENRSLSFLENLFFLNNPHLVASHIESKEKLNAYLAKTMKPVSQNKKKQDINNLLQQPTTSIKPNTTPIQTTQLSNTPEIQPLILAGKNTNPFFAGVVKNNKKLSLSGVLIYIKNEKGVTLRLLKTNLHGVFATFKPIPSGTYSFEIKDPNSRHFFDTMKIKVENINPKPFEFYSKELM